jgi:DNA-binding XRE family transcriptional regulator
VSGRNCFGKLRANIDADPERRARMDEKRKAYDVLLRLSELSELRRERGLTQAELAEALSVSQPAISRLEAASSRGGDRRNRGSNFCFTGCGGRTNLAKVLVDPRQSVLRLEGHVPRRPGSTRSLQGPCYPSSWCGREGHPGRL